MIDSKDLRIGNYVNSKLLGSNHRITGLLNDMFYTDLQLSYSNYEDWQPIELTDDILKSCRFKIFDSETWFPYWQINHTRSNELVGFSFKISTIGGKEWRWLEGNANVPFYYVNELQNLYYSLTGSELKIVW